MTMTAIKAYTDIEQSRKLAEILPLESADIFYVRESLNGEQHYHPIIITEHINRNFIIFEHNEGDGVLSWSLSALLNILPSASLDSSDDHHFRLRCKERFSEWHDNPIDACVEMILKLY